MVDGVGRNGSLARDAILAAIAKQQELAGGIQGAADALGGADATGAVKEASGSGFAAELKDGLRAIETEMHKTENLPNDMIAGRVHDFHEVAVQIKKSDLSFRFAMQVRNKLIDAYREVMRMNV